MAGVFVSYAREDAAKAKAIAREIEQAGFDVWIDQRIGSGSEFSREIEQALAGASSVVVVWSRHSIESPWVRDEAAEGRDSGRLVPVLLDDCRPPIGFRQFQATDLSHWSGRGRPKQIDEVIAGVRAKAGAPPQPRRAAVATLRWRRPTAWLLGAFAAVALTTGAYLFIARSGTETTAAPSLAILPFTADASDPDARKLASAARDSVAHTLSHGAFDVSAIDALPPAARSPADFLITGRVTSTAEKFTATVRMDETAHHYVVFSRQFETARDKADDFAELIGAQVAAVISWTAPLIAMERRYPSDPSVTASLLQSSVSDLDSVSGLHDYETSRRLAAKAPNSPMAQNNLAFSTAFALAEIPREERAAAVAAARRASARSIELAPEIGGNYIPWCLLHSEQRRIQCEERLRTGMRVDPDASFDNFFLAGLLLEAGRDAEAANLARLSYAQDPYMPHKIGVMLRTLEITGQTQESAQLFRQAVRWWPGSGAIVWRRFTGMTTRGDFKAAEQFAQEAGETIGPSPALSAINRNSLPLLRTACSAPKQFEPPICMLALARLGDLDSAFALAARLYPSRRGRTPQEEEQIWLDKPDAMPTYFLTGPGAAPLRRDPRFFALAQRVGLVEYWQSGRLPDFCRPPAPEPICPQLRRH